jgi:sugar lactone lactonase YvrE
MYHTDTPSRRIYRYDFDTDNGAISNKSLLVRTDKGCFPDGATVDAEGYIWSAQWAASQVVRYSPEGDVDFVLPLAVSQPTCVAFGGPELNLLFVTSAYQGMDTEDCAAEPQAGNLFIFQTDIKGIEDPKFQPN